jgi:hypothetical protein
MSDISQPSAPPPSAPSAPPPGQADIPITPSQGSPLPVGSQAPDRPPGQELDKSSRLARRAAIQSAFDRSAEAREEIGQRPKPSPRQDAQANQRVPQRDDEAAQRQPQHREAGRFARTPEGAPGQAPGQAPQRQYQPLHEQAPFRDAPPRFSEQARAEWHGTPESVRGAVHQMTREFAGAYQKYRGDSEVMDTVRPFHELATSHGTTLHQALTNYVGMEYKLRQDLIGGLDLIVKNLKLPGANGQPVNLRDVAYHILSMSPDQHRLTQQQNQTNASEMRLGQLHQMVEQLATGMGHMQYQQRFSQTRSAVDMFADSHPRFDELADLIKLELDHGYDLEQAYQRAILLRPGSAHAAQTRNTSAQTRRTSISGAPDTGPSDGRRSSDGANGKHPTRREAIARAMRRASSGA